MPDLPDIHRGAGAAHWANREVSGLRQGLEARREETGGAAGAAAVAGWRTCRAVDERIALRAERLGDDAHGRAAAAGRHAVAGFELRRLRATDRSRAFDRRQR